MNIHFFNFWHFLFLFVSFGGGFGLYFLLRDRNPGTVKAELRKVLDFLKKHRKECNKR